MIKLIVFIFSIPFWIIKFLLFVFLTLVILFAWGVGLVFGFTNIHNMEERVSNLWNYFFYTIDD